MGGGNLKLFSIGAMMDDRELFIEMLNELRAIRLELRALNEKISVTSQESIETAKKQVESIRAMVPEQYRGMFDTMLKR
jgi:hypothetical protein